MMNETRFTEVIKVQNGRFCNIDYHKRRMNRTTLAFCGKEIVLPLSDEDIPLEFRVGIVKCRIVYSLNIESIEYSHYRFRQLKCLKLVMDDNIDYSYKYADRSPLDALMQQKEDCDDILIVRNGYITDTSFSNVVFEDYKGGLYTPSTCLLAGTKRASLLDEGIVKEREIKVSDIENYSKIRIVNAMINFSDNIVIDVSHIKR